MVAGDWCILRTGGSTTLQLAKSLAEAGFEAWTPVENRTVRVGRKRELTEQETPILPSYVFARIAHLDELLALSHAPSLNYRVWDAEQKRMVVKGHPHFSVFRMNGRVRPQPDRSLASLRTVEAKLQAIADRRREDAKRKGPFPKFIAGQIVRVARGGFEGLNLKVAEDNLGKIVKLVHPDWVWTVEICAWKLQDVQVSTEWPEQGVALAA